MTFEEWYYNYWQLGVRVREAKQRDVDMAKAAWQAASQGIYSRDAAALHYKSTAEVFNDWWGSFFVGKRKGEILNNRAGMQQAAFEAWKAAQINLRDRFALGALNSIDQTHKHLFTEDCIARLAYEIADAMLREREK